jgi:hypothetical protein
MIGRLPRPRRNRNYGRQPRAHPLLRFLRTIRRKRVAYAYARAQACDTLRHLQKQIDRFQHLAKVYRVPVAPAEPFAVIPAVPTDDWIEFRRDMGKLVEPVKAPAPAPEPKSDMQTA